MIKYPNDDWMECPKCGKTFLLRVPNDSVPGGKMREEYYCPYCHAEAGSVMTSERPYTFKKEEITEE